MYCKLLCVADKTYVSRYAIWPGGARWFLLYLLQRINENNGKTKSIKCHIITMSPPTSHIRTLAEPRIAERVIARHPIVRYRSIQSVNVSCCFCNGVYVATNAVVVAFLDQTQTDTIHCGPQLPIAIPAERHFCAVKCFEYLFLICRQPPDPITTDRPQ